MRTSLPMNVTRGCGKDMQDMKADIRQVRNWVVTLFTLVVFGFMGAIVLRMFFST